MPVKANVDGKDVEYVSVGDVIETLQQVDPNTLIVMSKDAEGNGYSPLAIVDVTGDVYAPDSTWSGEVYSLEEREDWDEEDLESSGAIPCVTLVPVN